MTKPRSSKRRRVKSSPNKGDQKKLCQTSLDDIVVKTKSEKVKSRSNIFTVLCEDTETETETDKEIIVEKEGEQEDIEGIEVIEEEVEGQDNSIVQDKNQEDKEKREGKQNDFLCEIISPSDKLSQTTEKNQKSSMDQTTSIDLGTADEASIEENSGYENVERQLGQPTQDGVDLEGSLITGNQTILCSADTGHSEMLVQQSGYSGQQHQSQHQSSLSQHPQSMQIANNTGQTLDMTHHLQNQEKLLQQILQNQKQIQGSISTFEAKMCTISNQMSEQAEYIKDLECRVIRLEAQEPKDDVRHEELTSMSEHINRLERKQRERNLRLVGYEERSGENCRDIVSDIVYEQLGVEAYIEVAHRTGKKKDRPRHIIFTVSSVHDKFHILMAQRYLRDKNYFITEDLTHKDLERKRMLRPQIEKAKAEGHRWRFVNGKLYVSGKEVSHRPLEAETAVSQETHMEYELSSEYLSQNPVNDESLMQTSMKHPMTSSNQQPVALNSRMQDTSNKQVVYAEIHREDIDVTRPGQQENIVATQVMSVQHPGSIHQQANNTHQPNPGNVQQHQQPPQRHQPIQRQLQQQPPRRNHSQQPQLQQPPPHYQRPQQRPQQQRPQQQRPQQQPQQQRPQQQRPQQQRPQQQRSQQPQHPQLPQMHQQQHQASLRPATSSLE